MCQSCLGGWWVHQLQERRRRRKLPGLLLLLLHQSHAAVACDAAPLSAHDTMDSSPVLAHTRNKTMCAHMSAPIPHKLRVVLGSVDLIVRDDIQMKTDRQTDRQTDTEKRETETESLKNTIPQFAPLQAAPGKQRKGCRRNRSWKEEEEWGSHDTNCIREPPASLLAWLRRGKVSSSPLRSRILENQTLLWMLLKRSSANQRCWMLEERRKSGRHSEKWAREDLRCRRC